MIAGGLARTMEAMSYRTQEMGAPLVIVSLQRRVFAMDVATGERKWSFDDVMSRVEVVGNRVFVLGHRLSCLDYVTGKEHWSAALPHIARTLLVHGDYVVVAGVGEASCYSATGRLLWHDEFGGEGVAAVGLAVPGSSAQADRDH